MYNDKIKVANKIISDQDLMDIFQRMNDEIKENDEIWRQEKLQNEKFEREYQHYTTKNFEGTFKATVNFYDDTNVTIDTYDNFITIFDSRLHEIKNLWIRYHYSYWIQNGFEQNMISQYINLNIYETKMDIEVNLSSADKKMDDVYELIKSKIQNAPEKYDRIVRDKSKITNKVGLAIGLIPSIVICSLLAFVPMIRSLYGMTFVLYPIAVLFFGFIIGTTIASGNLERLYKNIIPEKKYAGWDSSSNRSVYKDDIESYKESSEIIIGKNINNIKNRQEIEEIEQKYSKNIPMELLVILVLSVVMIVIGKFIQ